MDGEGRRERNGDGNGRRDDNSTVMDSGARRQWTEQGQHNNNDQMRLQLQLPRQKMKSAGHV
jgi:hypothetical protein